MTIDKLRLRKLLGNSRERYDELRGEPDPLRALQAPPLPDVAGTDENAADANLTRERYPSEETP